MNKQEKMKRLNTYEYFYGFLTTIIFLAIYAYINRSGLPFSERYIIIEKSLIYVFAPLLIVQNVIFIIFNKSYFFPIYIILIRYVTNLSSLLIISEINYDGWDYFIPYSFFLFAMAVIGLYYCKKRELYNILISPFVTKICVIFILLNIILYFML